MRARHTALLILLGGTPAAAQQPPARVAAERTATVAAGPQYAAGGLHRFLFGAHYRDLWTTPVEVPVLDLHRTGGGLTPTTAGGGFQTRSLRFRGRDSLEYGFRSIDKDPSNFLEELQGTFIDEILRDQTSAAHPAGPALVAPLQEALDLLLPWRRMVVLPDDPALGQFRERFRGTLGFFEPRAIVEPGLRPFAGASEILDSDELFPRLRASPADRVDAGAFLRARLFDVFIGDWDRHRGNWGWARFGDAEPRTWIPVPEDRDQAFIRFDGVLLSLARIVAPRLTNFGPEYASMFGQTFNGRELDRWFLTGLEAPVWDSVAVWMQGRLTDSVLAAAVRAMPEVYQAIDGERMLRALTARRDRLREMARDYYALLAGEVDLHGTDVGETAIVHWHADGGVSVALGETGHAPWLVRRFHPGETREVRLYLHGGDDRTLVRGSDAGRILLRVIPGDGADELANAAPTPLRWYTEDGDRATGAVRVDRRAWEDVSLVEGVPHRDWGAEWLVLPWGGFAPDYGVYVGLGAVRRGYGFRHRPWDSRLQVRAVGALEAGTGRVRGTMQLYRSNSSLQGEFEVLASGIEVLNFHGFGNATDASAPKEFFRVNHRRLMLRGGPTIPLGPAATVRMDVGVRQSETAERPGRILETLPGLYGTGTFGQLDLSGAIEVDTRDVPGNARAGMHLTARGSVHPAVFDVTDLYASVEGSVSTYLTAAGVPLTPTLALRAGGRKLFGTFPFQDAAFIGSAETVRLGRENRYAGEAAVWGNAELRLDLFPAFLVLPARVGIFGLADAGRVFFDGDPATADDLHTALGGGLWIAWLDRRGTLSAALARSSERTAVYVSAGFAY